MIYEPLTEDEIEARLASIDQKWNSKIGDEHLEAWHDIMFLLSVIKAQRKQ